MSTFEVWAPKAKTVALKTGCVRIAMNQLPRGFWRLDTQDVEEYSFVIDGGKPLPDPRSRWQPYGVHGPSRVPDHSHFQWTDNGWQAPPLASAIVYELHIGTFTPEGTFLAAIQKLDHLKTLGVTHIDLMPVNEFSGAWGWGYDGVDIYAPHHHYGTPDQLKQFVNACHKKGLAVILDVVYNHLGPEGDYLDQFGPYYSDKYETPWGLAVNLDGPGCETVRRFFCDNAIMWVRDYHFDGLRLDAIHALLDHSALHLLEQLSVEVKELEAQTGRHLVLIAESDLNDPCVVTDWGMDAQWSDDFHHALHTVLTGERNGYYQDFGTLEKLAGVFSDPFIYDGRYSEFRRRNHGRAAGDVPGQRFLAYLQNHDQIGNRARGERTSQLLSKGRLKIGAALVFTSPYIPMLFQGEEWGAKQPFQYFTQHQDERLSRSVSEGRKREFVAFGWNPGEIPDPQDPATFSRCKLAWEDQDTEILEWHQKLIELRRSTPALSDCRRDKVETTFDEAAQWLRIQRGPVSVVVNLGEPHVTFIDAADLLLQSDASITLVNGRLQLPRDSVAIVSR
jgi:maltooligosyltrehalose trehalohydrolase